MSGWRPLLAAALMLGAPVAAQEVGEAVVTPVPDTRSDFVLRYRPGDGETPAAALASAGEAARRYCLEGYETGEVLKRAVPVVETDGAVVLAGRCLR